MRAECFRELLIKTKQQHTFLFHDNYEAFIELLDERQEIMDEIALLNGENPQPLSDEEKEIVLEIQRIDNENRVEYNRQLEEAKNEYRKLNQFQKREETYMNPYAAVMDIGRSYDYKGGK